MNTKEKGVGLTNSFGFFGFWGAMIGMKLYQYIQLHPFKKWQIKNKSLTFSLGFKIPPIVAVYKNQVKGELGVVCTFSISIIFLNKNKFDSNNVKSQRIHHS